jgi:hypothetical protein
MWGVDAGIVVSGKLRCAVKRGVTSERRPVARRVADLDHDDLGSTKLRRIRLLKITQPGASKPAGLNEMPQR